MGMWKPSFHRSIIKVTDCRYGPSLRHSQSSDDENSYSEGLTFIYLGLNYTERKRPNENISDLGKIYTPVDFLLPPHTSPHPSPFLTKWQKKTDHKERIQPVSQKIIPVTYDIDKRMLENRFSPLPDRHLSFTPCLFQRG